MLQRLYQPYFGITIFCGSYNPIEYRDEGQWFTVYGAEKEFTFEKASENLKLWLPTSVEHFVFCFHSIIEHLLNVTTHRLLIFDFLYLSASREVDHTFSAPRRSNLRSLALLTVKKWLNPWNELTISLATCRDPRENRDIPGEFPEIMYPFNYIHISQGELLHGYFFHYCVTKVKELRLRNVEGEVLSLLLQQVCKHFPSRILLHGGWCDFPFLEHSRLERSFVSRVGYRTPDTVNMVAFRIWFGSLWLERMKQPTWNSIF